MNSKQLQLSTSIDEGRIPPRSAYTREMYMSNGRAMEYSSLLHPGGIRFFHGGDEDEQQYFLNEFTKNLNKNRERLHVINILGAPPVTIKPAHGTTYYNQILWGTIDHIEKTIKTIIGTLKSVYIPYVNKKYDVVIINATDKDWEALKNSETYWEKWRYCVQNAQECNIILVCMTENYTTTTECLADSDSVNYYMGSINMRYAKQQHADRIEGHYKPSRLLRGYYTQPTKTNVLYVAQRRGNSEINPWARERSKYSREVASYYKSFLNTIEEKHT